MFLSGAAGSPPHARGKGSSDLSKALKRRITPARAGKRRNIPVCYRFPWDHPRTRGEKKPFLTLTFRRKGSPPHARGKDRDWKSFDKYSRITPARAGKRSDIAKTTTTRGDHPRTRGEKQQDDIMSSADRGSPPHARGKVQEIQKSLNPDGITPARAGKRLNKPPYYGHSSAAGHRISFNFPMSSYVSRQSVKALCAPRISIPKYSQSAVSVY